MTLKLIEFLLLAFFEVLSVIYFLMAKSSIANVMAILFTTVCNGLILMVIGLSFLGIAQILIYTGSISIVMVFALMIIGFLPFEEVLVQRNRKMIMLALPILLLFSIVVAIYVLRDKYVIYHYHVDFAKYVSNVEAIGISLYTEFAAPFDLAVLLLFPVLVSMYMLNNYVVGAHRPSQKEKKNLIPAPPAVYARSNSSENSILIKGKSAESIAKKESEKHPGEN
jgi:NADH-quinone oxidoreductase subunit J